MKAISTEPEEAKVGLKMNSLPESGAATDAPALASAEKSLDAQPSVPTPASPRAGLIDGSQKTWGEKVYNNTVYKFFGFGVNLGFSSLLTYLTLHSDWKMPLLKKKDGSGLMIKEVYGGLRDKFENSPITANLKGFSPVTEEVRKDRAKVMASALVLTLGGHIMIPIIKFFEDRKTGIVKWLDNKHYGPEAEENPEIMAAHQRVAEEIRPTLASTVLARLGSVLAVQLSARTIGIEKNLIKKGAEAVNLPIARDFNGLDRFTEEKGLLVANKLPSRISNATDKFLIKTSGGNVKPDAEHKPTALLFKYGFSDIVYTIITAVTIKPLNNWLIRHFEFLRKAPDNEIAEQKPKPAIRQAGLYSESTPETVNTVITANETPAASIRSGSHEGMLNETRALAKA